MMHDPFSRSTIQLGDKLLHSLDSLGNLPEEIKNRLKQKDLATEMLYSREDINGNYVVAWLAERRISTLPKCLKGDLRFQGKATYHELTLTQSAPLVEAKHKVEFYQALYPALYHKLFEYQDKQIVVKACFTENRWLRDIGFGPYEEVAFIAEDLNTIALTSVEAEAYYHFLKGDALEIKVETAGQS